MSLKYSQLVRQLPQHCERTVQSPNSEALGPLNNMEKCNIILNKL